MKVGLDVRMVENSGIGTTIKGLLDHLSPDRLKGMTLFHSPGWTNPYPTKQVEVPHPVYGIKQHWAYSKILNQSRPFLFHMPHFDVPLSYKGPFVATVHDLIHVLFPQYSNKPFSRQYALWMLRHVVKHARKIIAVSENTRQDLLNFFPKALHKVSVIYSGIDSVFQPVPLEKMKSDLQSIELTPGYLLYVGNLRDSKNVKGLLKAYSLLRAKTSSCPILVLAGRNFYGEFEKKGFPEGVKYMGQVVRDILPSLYSGAKVFVFPSFYEGFGLPPLEAMACGAPVVTSRVASLPEACGKAAVYVDPYDPGSIADGIQIVLGSSEKSKNLVQLGFENVKRFSWKKCADQTWEIYTKAYGDTP